MITFQTEGIDMPSIDQQRVAAWIRAVAASYGKRVGEIAYIFCSDERILEVNRQYLQHDYYTDITELHRVIVHGVLHLCGINDKGPGERELMEAAENRALALRAQIPAQP